MKMPHATEAVVAREKITNYLLNAAHPDNGGKAAFFQELGFTVAEWHLFTAALRQIAENVSTGKTVESSHGNKYVLDGQIETPSGKTPKVRTVWIIDRGLDKPRLVTSYPHDEMEKL